MRYYEKDKREMNHKIDMGWWQNSKLLGTKILVEWKLY